MSTERYPQFKGLGPIVPGQAESLLKQLLPQVLPRLASWAKRTIVALPEQESNAAGYRDFLPDANGNFSWYFPRSNSAERIDAYLWLSKKLNDPTYKKLAIRYADAMANDPIRGIYQGNEEDGIGQVWYWPDFGLYMTIYTMRVPPAFLNLAQETGDTKYAEIAYLSGRQLLHSQKETGLFREGWKPTIPAPGIKIDLEKMKSHLTTTNINSRIGYIALTLTRLYQITNNPNYIHALEKFAAGFVKYQNPNGSFPAIIRNDRFEAVVPTVKGHFHSYIINGIAKAACMLPEIQELQIIAKRLGDYIVNDFRQSWAVPYINLCDQPTGGEQNAWHSSSPDVVSGLAWLAKLTGNPTYREVACMIALQSVLRVFDCPKIPDMHGGFPLWEKRHRSLPDGPAYSIGGWFHFGLILGLQALEQTE